MSAAGKQRNWFRTCSCVSNDRVWLAKVILTANNRNVAIYKKGNLVEAAEWVTDSSEDLTTNPETGGSQ